MGTNRLSDRLKSLERDGVITKALLPPPGEAQVYVLTDAGERLRRPVIDLAQWGAGLPIDDRVDRSTARAALLALVRCAAAAPELIHDVRATYDFEVGDERFHIIVADGTALARSGPAPLTADVTVRCDLATLLELDTGAITPARARRERQASITGPAPAVRRAFGIVSRRASAGR
jgi:hypothetical protein